MKLSLNKLFSFFETTLKKTLKKQKNKLILTIFTFKNQQKNQISLKLKEKIAKKLGIKLNFIDFQKTPNFINFAKTIKKEAEKKEVTGIIIEKPIPTQLMTDSLYNYIPKEKEIEGLRLKALVLPPQGLAILTMIKYFLTGKINDKIIIDPKKDINFWKKALKNKKIVLLGRDEIYAKPITKIFQEFKINHLNIDLNIKSTEEYLQQADIIINTSDKPLENYSLKPNSIIINYSPLDSSLEPLVVYYLFKNMVGVNK